jgi:hypothetical protein
LDPDAAISGPADRAFEDTGSFAVSTCTESRLDFHTPAVHRGRAYPAIDATAIISDLKSAALHRFDEMQILAPADFAEHNIADLQLTVACDGFHRTELPGFNLAGHRVAARSKSDRFASAKLLDQVRCPTHASRFPE